MKKLSFLVLLVILTESFEHDAENIVEITVRPMADISVIRGTEDALSMCIDLPKLISFETIEFSIYAGSIKATNDQISELRFYKGAPSDNNLLDISSGSNLENGYIIFNDFSSLSDNYCLTLSFIDADPSDFGVIKTALSRAIATDRDGNLILFSGDDNHNGNFDSELFSTRIITVTDSGSVNIIENADNEPNQYTKSI